MGPMHGRTTPSAQFGERVRARRSRPRMVDRGPIRTGWPARTYVGSVERGERNVSLINILRIAAALECDAGER